MKTDEKIYRGIVEAVPQGIWLVDPQGRTIFNNKRMAEILGADTESLSEQSCFECVFPDELAEAQGHFARGMAGDRQPFDFRLRRNDGSALWVSISCMPVYDDTGATLGLLGLFTDISERREAMAALRESEERFRNMADTAPVMIWVSGSDRFRNFFNKSWLVFTGRTMERELGNGWTEGVHPDDLDQCLATYTSAFDARHNFHMEYRLRGADGEYRWVFDTGVPRLTELGAFAGYVGSCIDVTDLKRTQQQIFATQKLESLGVLAGAIAHDFNNLLSSILINTESVLSDLPADSPSREDLHRIKDVAVRAAEIVRQLMAYAGQEDTHVEPIDVGSLITEMLRFLRVSISKYAILQTDFAEHLPAVRANAAEVSQVVMNLVTNASEAIGDKGGVITVSTSLVRIRENSVTGAAPDLPEGDYIRLDVTDTGCGMTRQIQARIFEPFFTTKFPGRGLGLAAVHGIIRSHGGAINVESAPDQGSRFEVLLPCSRESVRNTAETLAPAPAAETGADARTILVVEDEDALRVAVSKTLRRNGFRVIEAVDGNAGVDLFRANHPGIDVVLLDMTLPGLSGREVLRELQRIQPHVNVILTTAYSEGTALTSLDVQRSWSFVRKPYQVADLINLIRNQCARQMSDLEAS